MRSGPTPHNLLAYLKSDRARIEKELQMQREIEKERAARDAAKSELMQMVKR